MQDTIEKLKGSALFNLSLSSKELFHSNFLYWFAQNYPAEFGSMFYHLIKEQPDDPAIVSVAREKENIDLSFTYANQQEIVLENKVKSIPYIGQLKRYSKNHNEFRNYILLSLSEPLFFDTENKMLINGATWYYMSYSMLLKQLRIVAEKIRLPYHKSIIQDYLEFMEGLIEVNNLCMLKENDYFDFHSLRENKVYRSLMEIRLHDFYLKKKYELLAYEVFKKMKSMGKKVTNFGSHLNWENNSDLIYFGFGMTNAQGLMDVKYRVSDDLVLGIQVQGEHYRMFVEDKSGLSARKIKEKLEDGYWFDFNRSFPGQRIYPNPEKRFNKYGNTFFYKSVKLGIRRRIKDIVNAIISDVAHIEANQIKIKDLLSS